MIWGFTGFAGNVKKSGMSVGLILAKSIIFARYANSKHALRRETEVSVPNCRFCGKPVYGTPVDHPECRMKKREDLAKSVCDYSCKWNSLCEDKERLKDVHCRTCALRELVHG